MGDCDTPVSISSGARRFGHPRYRRRSSRPGMAGGPSPYHTTLKRSPNKSSAACRSTNLRAVKPLRDERDPADEPSQVSGGRSRQRLANHPCLWLNCSADRAGSHQQPCLKACVGSPLTLSVTGRIGSGANKPWMTKRSALFFAWETGKLCRKLQNQHDENEMTQKQKIDAHKS